MSEKKPKSKSKSKEKDKEKAEKPPKDTKSKKSKDDKADSKSRKSVDKTEKVPKKKKDDKSEKEDPPQQDLDLSQDNFSDFLKNPFSFPPAITTDDAYFQIYPVCVRTTKNPPLCSARSASKQDAKAASSTAPIITRCTG
jgi:hypothetical protein